MKQKEDKMEDKREIVICDECKGTGIHKFLENNEKIECKKCAGTGRLVKNINYIPFWEENI